jgi:hypothetical protein
VVHPTGANEGSRREELSVGAVEGVKDAVAVGMEDELAILAFVHAVHQHQVFGGVPVVGVVGGELVVPLAPAGIGIESQRGAREQVVACADVAIDVGAGIADGPEQCCSPA